MAGKKSRADRKLDKLREEAREIDELLKNKHLYIQFEPVKISLLRTGGIFIRVGELVKVWLSHEALIITKTIINKVWTHFASRSRTPLHSSPRGLLEVIRVACLVLACTNFLIGFVICLTSFATLSSSEALIYQSPVALLQFILLAIVATLYWTQAKEISTELTNRASLELGPEDIHA